MWIDSIWLAVPLQQKFGLYPTAIVATFIGSIGLVIMAYVDNMWWSLAFLMLSRVGVAVKGASGGQITANLTTPKNRGEVFSQVQMALNMGRLVGPLVAGNLATTDPIHRPWLLAGVCGCLSGVVLFFAQPSTGEQERQAWAAAAQALDLGGFADLEAVDQATCLRDEQGSAGDYEELGRYLGELLTKRHYRWISHKQAVFDMLDEMLPELSRQASAHLTDLDKLIRHAHGTKHDFHHEATARSF